MAEKTVELMSGSPLEMKLEEVLGKVTAMESAMTKMTALFEGGVFNGKQERIKQGSHPYRLG